MPKLTACVRLLKNVIDPAENVALTPHLVFNVKFYAICYTEDLHAVIAQHTIDHHLYADDTQLSVEPSITSVAASIANIETSVQAVHV